MQWKFWSDPIHLPEKHLPESTFTRKTLGQMDSIPNIHFPERTLARMYIWPNGRFPETLFSRIKLLFFDKIDFEKKNKIVHLFFISLTNIDF